MPACKPNDSETAGAGSMVPEEIAAVVWPLRQRCWIPRSGTCTTRFNTTHCWALAIVPHLARSRHVELRPHPWVVRHRAASVV